MMDNHPALKLLNQLLDVPSPPGREEQMAAIVKEHLDAMGFEHEQDPAGNILVRLPGRQPDKGVAMFASHMDEIAITVTQIEEDGRLRVIRSGGLLPWKIGECPVEIVGDKGSLTGLISFGSTHTGNTKAQRLEWKDACILTDLTPQELAEKGIRIGSSAVPVRSHRGPHLFGNPNDPLVAAWTFDDRMGVVTLLRLLESIKKKNVTPIRPTNIAFTIQEEGGCHGAAVLAHRERPEIFVAVDGCPMPPEAALKLDGRPAVWSKDQAVHFDQRLVRQLLAAAEKAGTQLQQAVYEYAYSDASRAFASGAVPRTVTVGHVRENSHGYEVARLSCFDNLLKTLETFIVELD